MHSTTLKNDGTKRKGLKLRDSQRQKTAPGCHAYICATGTILIIMLYGKATWKPNTLHQWSNIVSGITRYQL